MAANNNESRIECELWDVDPNEISISAFDSIDAFKPKVYTKQVSFGKRKSFLCYKNPAFDSSFDAFEEDAPFDTVDLGADNDEKDAYEMEIEGQLPSSQRRRNIRNSSLRYRKETRGLQKIPECSENADSGHESVIPRSIGKWKHFKFRVAMSWDGFKSDIMGFFKDIDFWKSNLKAVEGKFGSGVLSYFKFLRWLFLLDVVISILILAFVVTPQLMYSPSYKTNNVSFTGMEFLTGKGWFLKTEMYFSNYGGYKNDTVILSYETPYNLTFAYLLVAGGYILMCLIILVRSMAISYNKNYISGQDFKNSFFTKIFCSWDYSVIQENSVVLQCKNIHNDLMESLTESREKREKQFNELAMLACQRLITHFIVIGLMGGSCFAVYWVKMYGVDRLKEIIPLNKWTDIFFNLFPAITITALNIILPFAFRIIASQEGYDSPRTTIEVSLFRTVLLKLSTLCVYIWLVYTDIEKFSASKVEIMKQNVTLPMYNVSNANVTKAMLGSCWETEVGVQFYQLAVVDFIFVILETFFGEMMRRGFADFMNFCCFNFDHPGFDISRNVLGLIYSQGLCWLGAFFCPMLPLITVIKFFILFYYKKGSVLSFCRPSMRPFKASKMRLRFLFLLGFMLALAIIVIGLVVINETRLKPSINCGPFRGKKSIFSTVQVVLNRDFGRDLRNVTKSFASTIVLAMVFFVLSMVIYFQRLRKSSAEKKIKLLKDQIVMAGHDKLFLLKQIRSILEGRAREARQFSS